MERLSKLNPGSLIRATKVEDEGEKEHLMNVYVKMRALSISCFCDLLEKHPHFNYRLNVLQSVMPRLASQDTV